MLSTTRPTRPESERGDWISVALLCVLPLLICCTQAWAAEWYALSFSTYLGGGNWEHARDVCVDKAGNVYMVGGTASTNFPVTPGSYQQQQNTTGTDIGSGGYCDGFVAKFSPAGNLIWCTYLGGPNYDRVYGVEVDDAGHVYVAGRAGPGFPVTAGAFQTTFQGAGSGGAYGKQNAFVAKLSPDGSNLVWASYVGVGGLCRDLALDHDGDIYLPLGYTGSGAVPPAQWFTNAFQKTPRGGSECGVVKVANSGSNVLWATWLGGTANETQSASVRVDQGKTVYLFFNTQSPNMPTTDGAHDRTQNGGEDTFLARLSADGSSLLYGTYLGGTGTEWAVNTHNLALDPASNAYVSVVTASADFPTTPGAFKRSLSGTNDIAIVKFSPTGSLVFSTFVGGSGTDNPDGIYADSQGNVFFVGETQSSDFPTTSNAFQRTFGGKSDAVAVRLSADFASLLYSTFLGGTNADNGRSAFLGEDGSLYVTGASDGPGWPIKHAWQSAFAGGGGRYGNGDCVLAKFIPPNSALRFPSVSVAGSVATLVLSNLTETIPYTIRRTDCLTSVCGWTAVHSFTSSAPVIVWSEDLSGRTSAFYRAKSGR